MQTSEARIRIAFAIVFVTIAMPFLGTYIAQGEYFELALATGICAGVGYAVAFSRYWIVFALLYAALDVQMQPIGFMFDALAGCCLFGIIFVVVNFWRRGTFIPAPSSPFFRYFLAVLAFCAYLGIHLLVNKWFPYRSADIALQNSLKTYFAMSGGFLIAALALLTPRSSRFPKNIAGFATWLLLIALTFNVALRLYGIFALHAAEPNDATGEGPGAVLYIPILNLTDNYYALRTLGPFCFLFGLVLFTAPQDKTISPFTRFLSGVMILGGLAGSLTSMGRIAFFLCLFFGAIVFIKRRRFLTLFSFFALSLALTFSFKFLYDYNPQAVPLGIQRALAILPFMGMNEASDAIENSSDWRTELFVRALEDWEDSPRTILTGRSSYAWTDKDEANVARFGWEGSLISSLRRGSTHNLLTDLLVTVGSIGFILYSVAYWTLVVTIKRVATSGFSDCVRLILVIYLPTIFVVGLIGGGFLSAIGASTVALLAVAMQRANQPPPRKAEPETPQSRVPARRY